MFAREVDGTDFRPSRLGDGADPVAAHSMRECRGAMVRRRRLSAYLGFPVADACWREEDVTIFSSLEKRRWGGATLISKPLGERRLSGVVPEGPLRRLTRE